MESTIDDIETKNLAMQTMFVAIFVFRIWGLLPIL